MANVPRHFRRQAVSSRTGINTLDTSGADAARAIARMAGEFQQVAAVAFEQQKQRSNRSERAKKKANYLLQTSTATKEIQKEFAENPEEGFNALKQKHEEIKQGVLSGISDSGLQADVGADLDGLMAQQLVNGRTWQIQRESALEQQFLIDVQHLNIEAITKGVTAEEYQIMLDDDTFTEENYKKAWDPEEGAKNFQTAKNAMFRARATTLAEKGNFFEAQDFIEKSEEPDAKTRGEVEKNFLKMQRGTKARRLFETVSAASIDVVETQEGVLADELTASQLDDRVLEVSAQAVATPDPDQQKVLIQYAQVLADIRDAKMEQILLRAPGDTNVEARLQARYEALINRNDGDATADPATYLTDFLDFQSEIIAEGKVGNVSAKSYNKWMFWSKVALEGFDPKAGWFDNNVAREKGVRKKLKAFLDDYKDKDSVWKINAMREVYEGLPAENIELLSDEATDALFRRGKIIASLKELGFPIDIVDSKVVRTSAGNFNVVDFDQDGVPILNVTTQNMER